VWRSLLSPTVKVGGLMFRVLLRWAFGTSIHASSIGLVYCNCFLESYSGEVLETSPSSNIVGHSLPSKRHYTLWSKKRSYTSD